MGVGLAVLPADGSVVHEDVDAAVGSERGLGECLALPIVGDVGNGRGRSRTEGLGGGHRLVERGLRPTGGDDCRALGSEALEAGAPHAGTRAGDDRDPTRKAPCHPDLQGERRW